MNYQNRKKTAFATKQRGVSLMEFMLYAALAAGAVVVSVMGYVSAGSVSAGNQVTREIMSIRTGANTVRGVAADYSGITIATLSTGKALPTTVASNGKSVSSGATYTFDTATAPATTTQPGIQVSVAYDVCSKLLANMDSSWVGVKGGGLPSLTATPLSQANISSACGSSGTASVEVYFSN